LNTTEVKRLEEENRRLQYLKAKKKFREYKKRFQEDLEEWRSERSPATSRSQKNQMESPVAAAAVVAEEGARVHTSPASHQSPQPSHPPLRSSSSAGNINGRNHQGSCCPKGSSSSLPQIPTAASSSRRRELERAKLQPVKESDHESSKELKTEQRPQRVKPAMLPAPSTEKNSFLTALDDVLGGEESVEGGGEDLGEGEPLQQSGQGKSLDDEEKAKEELPRKRRKPEWMEVRPSDSLKRDPARRRERKREGESEQQQRISTKRSQKIAKLVNSAKECYSEKPEEGTTATATSATERKMQRKVDTSFTKRRRNRLDPRNNIKAHPQRGAGQSLKRKKRQQQQREILSQEESEALRKIEESVAVLSVKGSDSAAEPIAPSIAIAPQRAVEILEKHQTPNLAQVKKLAIGKRVVKSSVTPVVAVAVPFPVVLEVKGEEAEEVEEAEEAPSMAMRGGGEGGAGAAGEYDDEGFDSDGDDALPGSKISAAQSQLPSPPPEILLSEEEEYKDDDEFEEDLEASLSPARGTFNSSAKFLSGSLRVSLPQEEQELEPLGGDSMLGSSNSRPSTRLRSRERGAEGIELLSGGTGSQRIGSASSRSGSRRSSHRPKLPPFDNTDPLILCSASATTTGDPDRPVSRHIPAAHGSSKPTDSIATAPHKPSSLPANPSTSSRKPSHSSSASSMNLPTNFKFVQPTPTAATATAAAETRRSSAPQLPPGGLQHLSGRAPGGGGGVGNVDSKSHQRVMDSERSTGMRLAVLAAGGPLNIPAEEVGSPSQLDMNIMKQSGQVRRAIKREDSFDKLTRKIAKTLRQSSL
jgi:hypothetical protein